MVTDSTKRFHSTSVVETDPSECHKFIISFFNSYFEKLPAKRTAEQNYKNFNSNSFLYDLDQEFVKVDMYQCHT